MDQAKQTIAAGLSALTKVGFTLPDGLRPECVEEIVTTFNVKSEGTGKPGSRQMLIGTESLFIRLNHDVDWPAIVKSLSKQYKDITNKDLELTEIREDGLLIYRVGVIPILGPRPIHIYMPDRHSVVISGILRNADDTRLGLKEYRELIRNVATARKRDWGTGYEAVARAPIAAVLDNHDGKYSKLFVKDLDADHLRILDNIRFAAVGIEVGDGRPVRLVLDAKSASVVHELEKGMDGVFRLIVNEAEHTKHDSGPAAKKLVSELWQSHKLNRAGTRLEWLAYSTVRLQHLYFPGDDNSGKEPPNQKRD
jgi:hypothetical protein